MKPATREELATMLADASRDGRRVLPTGGGTHRRQGRPAAIDEELSTLGLNRIVAHEPADLTVTVEAGTAVTDLDTALSAAGQCWPQPDLTSGATVGGVLASATSGRGRLRNGPVRDGLLEVVVATGDGRIVKAGGKTVKGVAGYDLCRLLVGSMGALGVICEVTLKLWPRPSASAWFTATGDVAETLATADYVLETHHRPTSVILTPGVVSVNLTGTATDVTAPEGLSSGDAPGRIEATGRVRVGVPPTELGRMVQALARDGRPYEAFVGVGSIEVGIETLDDLRQVREDALALGGHAVVIDAPDALRSDPWGPPPPGVSLMHQIKATFDPAGILAPGRLVEAA